jgi:hypothetical protein
VSREAVLSDLRTEALMKVVPYWDDFGSFPYALSDVERALIESASPAEWQRARNWIAAERFLIECEFRTLAALLSVVARHPNKLPVMLTIGAPAPAARASRWARLRRWVRRRRHAQRSPDAITVQASRWELPTEDFRTAVLALAELGWTKAA